MLPRPLSFRSASTHVSANENVSADKHVAANKHVVARWPILSVGAFCVCLLSTCHAAFADTPAVTDFGSEATAVFQQDTRPVTPTRAMFVTLYGDGRQQVQLQAIHGDAIVSFAGDHPAWRYDKGLTFLVNMPVYIREVPAASLEDSQSGI